MAKREAKVRTRAFLFSPEHPDKGVLFKSSDAIAEALEQGWEESPAAAKAAKKPATKKSGGSSQKPGGADKVTTGDNS